MTDAARLNELLHLADCEQIGLGELADELPDRIERAADIADMECDGACERCGGDISLPGAKLCEACDQQVRLGR